MDDLSLVLGIGLIENHITGICKLMILYVLYEIVDSWV